MILGRELCYDKVLFFGVSVDLNDAIFVVDLYITLIYLIGEPKFIDQ